MSQRNQPRAAAVACLFLSTLFHSSPLRADDDPPAGASAIEEAIATLEARLADSEAAADKQTISQAIEALKKLLSPPDKANNDKPAAPAKSTRRCSARSSAARPPTTTRPANWTWPTTSRPRTNCGTSTSVRSSRPQWAERSVSREPTRFSMSSTIRPLPSAGFSNLPPPKGNRR